jgi:dipeptidyl aminopeptidase/acylaminoacyl peptidase
MASAPAPTATYTYKSASGVDLQADVFLPADASKKNLPILLWLQ